MGPHQRVISRPTTKTMLFVMCSYFVPMVSVLLACHHQIVAVLFGLLIIPLLKLFLDSYDEIPIKMLQPMKDGSIRAMGCSKCGAWAGQPCKISEDSK